MRCATWARMFQLRWLDIRDYEYTDRGRGRGRGRGEAEDVAARTVVTVPTRAWNADVGEAEAVVVVTRCVTIAVKRATCLAIARHLFFLQLLFAQEEL